MESMGPRCTRRIAVLGIKLGDVLSHDAWPQHPVGPLVTSTSFFASSPAISSVFLIF